MDARDWEQSQSRRASIKRSWEDDAGSPRQSNVWNGSVLPPIGIAPYRRPSIQQPFEPPTGTESRYLLEHRESVAKRARYETDEYGPPLPNPHGINTEHQSRRPSYSLYPAHQGSPDSFIFPQKPLREGWEQQDRETGGGPAGKSSSLPSSSPILCSRCRRITMPHHDQELLQPNGVKLDTNSRALALVTQTAAVQLTKALTTLSSCFSSERQGIIRDQGLGLESNELPPLEQVGLEQTFDWLIGKIELVNELASEIVQHVPSAILPTRAGSTLLRNGMRPQDGIHDNMKRHMHTDPDESFVSGRDGGEPIFSDSKLHTRRKSVAMASIPSSEELPSMRSYHDNPLSYPSLDGSGRRGSIMNPPPTPSRQLPSPPGLCLPSPSTINLPSPSAVQYNNNTQAGNFHSSSSVPSSSSSYLPSIGASSTDTALQAHAASLQHEVSIQKIAISSLQGEHDKLLAAFSRSQTRAAALEKKHTVADTEIITLSEEKLRLQTQVIDLERDVDELTRSREGYREAAVHEGAQYVEIVKKASQLEEMAAEERKSWNRLKLEMEQRIDILSAGSGSRVDIPQLTVTEHMPLSRSIEDVTVSVASADALAPLPAQVEGKSGTSTSSDLDRHFQPLALSAVVSDPPTLIAASSHPIQSASQEESVRKLEEQVRVLRARVLEVEETLRAVRDDSRNVEDMAKALGLAGKSILDRADGTLANLSDAE